MDTQQTKSGSALVSQASSSPFDGSTHRVRRANLQAALDACLAFAQRPGDNPLARHRAARAYRLMGDLQEDLGRARALGRPD